VESVLPVIAGRPALVHSLVNTAGRDCHAHRAEQVLTKSAQLGCYRGVPVGQMLGLQPQWPEVPVRQLLARPLARDLASSTATVLDASHTHRL